MGKSFSQDNLFDGLCIFPAILPEREKMIIGKSKMNIYTEDTPLYNMIKNSNFDVNTYTYGKSQNRF